MSQLGNFVKKHRLDANKTQEEYALMLGMSKPTVIKIEQGKYLGMQTLRKLSAYYNVSVKLLRRWMIFEDNES